MNKKIAINLLRLFLAIILLIVFVFLLKWLKGIILPFLLAAILAYLLNPLVEYWESKGFSRSGGIFLTYFFFLIIILFFTLYLFPVFWKQLEVLALSTPQYTKQIQSFFQDSYDNYKKIPIPNVLRNEIDLALVQLELIVTKTIAQIIDGILATFTYALSILIAPILAYYILKDHEYIGQSLLKYFPQEGVEKLQELWGEIDSQLNQFIKGHLLVAFLVGMITAIGLVILGIDFPFLLGLIVGITEIIPYFGPLIGSIPVLGIAILDSKGKLISALILMIIVQQVESNLISPKIIGAKIGLHPLLVISVLLLGGKIYGVLGILFAIPVTVVLRVFWRYFIDSFFDQPEIERDN